MTETTSDKSMLSLVLSVYPVRRGVPIQVTCSGNFQKHFKTKIPPDYATTVEMCFETGPDWIVPWAKTAKRVINTFLCVMQLGFCAVYFVFVSRNIQQVMLSYDIDIDVHVYMAIILVPILLECLVRNLKFIAPMSSVANALMGVGLAITFYYASIDMPRISERRFFGELKDLPLFLGTVIYAFVAIGLVIPLKSEMKQPELFQKPLGVLNVGVTIVTVLLVTAGFLGYMKWGDDVQGSLTLNLPKDSSVSLVLQSILAIAIMFTLPIQFYVPVDILWPAVKEKYGPFKNTVTYELGLRVALVLLTFTMAEVIPHLNIFISFIGATCSSSVALIFPPIMELMYKSRHTEGVTLYIFIKDILIILFGFVAFATGTYEGTRAIINVLS